MSRAIRQIPEDKIQFVLDHGYRAHSHHLARTLDLEEKDIEVIRNTGASKRRAKGLAFPELFALRHGRPPEEADWPLPRQYGDGRYEWQGHDVALLASLVGQMSVAGIAKVLTARLKKQTGDKSACRNQQAVQIKMNEIGLMTSDLVGGITVQAAARELGAISTHPIYTAIENKELTVRKIGRLFCIPHDEWERWKSTRVFAPKGYVQLTKFKEPLGIKSDKLSEFARRGDIPTAIRCNPSGTGQGSTKFGTWFIDAKVGRKLVADRRAGRPMPWHNRPDEGNLRVTFKLWNERKHPASCETCRMIWGKKGVPKTWADYAERYPPLEHGAKRHLTMKWTPGLTIPEVVRQSTCSRGHVERAIENGMLEAVEIAGKLYVTRTAATRWVARHCPTGEGIQSWVNLDTAQSIYLFSRAELNAHIREKRLKTRIETAGWHRGELMVSKHQLRVLRERIGFTHAQAARKLKITKTRLLELLDRATWRAKGDKLPLEVVQTLAKRIKSKNGYTVEEAAKKVRKAPSWVRARIKDGTVKLVRAHWDRRRTYLSDHMIERLRTAAKLPAVKRKPLGSGWMLVGSAAVEAGVSITTLKRWGDDGLVERRQTEKGWRYRRGSVRAHTRRYWKTQRFHRAVPPAWMLARR